MDEEEPTSRDFLASLWDTLASNRLVRVLRAKFHARSYVEFFNRLWGTGVLLFVIGLLIGALAISWESYQFSVLDLTNTAILVVAALLVWILLTLVGIVNDGDTPLYPTKPPNWKAELAKFTGGSIIILAFAAQFYFENADLMEFLAFSVVSAVIMGMWLIALSWFLGGLSGLLRVWRESNSKGS